MFCTGCGKKLPDNLNFCTACGKQVKRTVNTYVPSQDIVSKIPVTIDWNKIFKFWLIVLGLSLVSKVFEFYSGVYYYIWAVASPAFRGRNPEMYLKMPFLVLDLVFALGAFGLAIYVGVKNKFNFKNGISFFIARSIGRLPILAYTIVCLDGRILFRNVFRNGYIWVDVLSCLIGDLILALIFHLATRNRYEIKEVVKYENKKRLIIIGIIFVATFVALFGAGFGVRAIKNANKKNQAKKEAQRIEKEKEERLKKQKQEEEKAEKERKEREAEYAKKDAAFVAKYGENPVTNNGGLYKFDEGSFFEYMYFKEPDIFYVFSLNHSNKNEISSVEKGTYKVERNPAKETCKVKLFLKPLIIYTEFGNTEYDLYCINNRMVNSSSTYKHCTASSEFPIEKSKLGTMLSDSYSAYVNYVDNLKKDIGYIYTDDGSKVNVRDRPSTNGNVVGQFMTGEGGIEKLAESDNYEYIDDKYMPWYKVKKGNLTGWIFGGFWLRDDEGSTW